MLELYMQWSERYVYVRLVRFVRLFCTLVRLCTSGTFFSKKCTFCTFIMYVYSLFCTFMYVYSLLLMRFDHSE